MKAVISRHGATRSRSLLPWDPNPLSRHLLINSAWAQTSPRSHGTVFVSELYTLMPEQIDSVSGDIDFFIWLQIVMLPQSGVTAAFHYTSCQRIHLGRSDLEQSTRRTGKPLQTATFATRLQSNSLLRLCSGYKSHLGEIINHSTRATPPFSCRPDMHTRCTSWQFLVYQRLVPSSWPCESTRLNCRYNVFKDFAEYVNSVATVHSVLATVQPTVQTCQQSSGLRERAPQEPVHGSTNIRDSEGVDFEV